MFSTLIWDLLLTTVFASGLMLATRTRFMRRRPSLRHSLWLLVLVKLITPSLVQVPLLPATPPDDLVSNSSNNSFADGDAPEFYAVQSPMGDLGLPNAPPIQMEATNYPVGNEAPFSVSFLLGFGSIAGSITLAVIYFFRTAQLRRWLNRATIQRNEVTECCRSVATSLGIRSEISSRAVNARTTPLLWGLLRPVLIVPNGLIESLNQEQLRGVIAHELAHYVRRDHWSNLFACAVKVIMWWNPIAWLAHRELRSAQESCCDAIAIGISDRRDYATALFQTLNFVQKGPFANHELALGVEENGSILRRFEMIADTQLSHRLPRVAIPLILLLSTVLICIPVNGQQKSDVSNDSSVVHQGGSSSKVDEGVKESEESFFLSGIFAAADADRLSAYIVDRKSQEKTLVNEGDIISLLDREAKIGSIDPRSIEITLKGKEPQRWNLGETLPVERNRALDRSATSKWKTVIQKMPETHNSPEDRLAVDRSVEPQTKQVNVESDEQVSVQLEVVDGQMIIRGSKENVAHVKKLIGKISDRNSKNPEKKQEKQTNELGAYKLVGVEPQLVLSVLKTLFEGSSIRLDVDPKNQNLIVFGTKQEHEAIRKVLNQLEKPARLVRHSRVGSPEENATVSHGKGNIRFSFKNAPWMEVLMWFAETAKLSLVVDQGLPGTMSYSDPQPYTIDESMDVLNGLLLTKGYSLFRRDRVLHFVSVDNGVPKELVSPITYEQLGGKGNYEFVSVMFPIGDRDPESVRKEITPLLTRAGSVDILRATRQILVTDRKNKMQAIKLMIGSIPQPKNPIQAR